MGGSLYFKTLRMHCSIEMVSISALDGLREVKRSNTYTLMLLVHRSIVEQKYQ